MYRNLKLLTLDAVESLADEFVLFILADRLCALPVPPPANVVS